MTKKELEKRIAELELLVEQKDFLIQNLQSQLNQYPITVPFQELSDRCSDGGEHDYPNPWHSISPAFCKKCGKQAEQHPITYSNGTGNLPWNFEEHGGNVVMSNTTNSKYMGDQSAIN